MEDIKIPRKTWLVVCDGAKALILRNDGDAELLNLIPIDVMFEVHPPTREQGSDRQGRTYQPQGAARSAVEETDWHSEAERSFLAKVADWLNSGVQDHSIRQVVLIAPPKALGILRNHLLPSTRATVIAEIAKDLVKMPIPEIEKFNRHVNLLARVEGFMRVIDHSGRGAVIYALLNECRSSASG